MKSNASTLILESAGDSIEFRMVSQKRLNRRRLVPGFFLIQAVLLALAASAHAGTYYWNTNTTGNWNVGASWSDNGTSGGTTGTVAGSGDMAVFNQTSKYAATVTKLSGATSVNGITFRNTGTTIINNSGSTQTLTIGAGGILVESGAGAVTIGNSLAVNITLGAAQTWTNNASTSLTVSANGASTVNTNGNLLTVNGTGNVTFGGSGTGFTVSGGGGVTYNGTGSLNFSGWANTFTGPLTVASGTLKISTINNASANGPLGNSASAVTLGSTGGVTGTLSYSGGNASSTKKFTMAAGGTGGFSVGNATNTLTLSGVIDGGGGIAKSGPGTLALSANNTFTGDTVVSAGTLVLSGGGVINTSSSVSVLTAATLTNNTGTALTPALSLGEGSALSGSGSFTPAAMTLTANLADGFTPITAGSTLTKAGALTFTLSGVVDGSYALFTGSPASSFTSVNVGGNPLAFDSGDSLWKGTVGGFDYAYSDSANTLSVAAIPEPGTWIMVGIGLAFLLYRKPRRLDP